MHYMLQKLLLNWAIKISVEILKLKEYILNSKTEDFLLIAYEDSFSVKNETKKIN